MHDRLCHLKPPCCHSMASGNSSKEQLASFALWRSFRVRNNQTPCEINTPHSIEQLLIFVRTFNRSASRELTIAHTEFQTQYRKCFERLQADDIISVHWLSKPSSTHLKTSMKRMHRMNPTRETKSRFLCIVRAVSRVRMVEASIQISI